MSASFWSDVPAAPTSPGFSPAMQTGTLALETSHDLASSVREACGDEASLAVILRVKLVPREG